MGMPREPRRRSRRITDHLVEVDADFFSHSADRARERKLRQLCDEVQRLSALFLAGEVREEVLQDVMVLHTHPAPDASRLELVLAAPSHVDVDAVRAALERIRGPLRHVLATSLHRKRVPELTFTVVPPGPAPLDLEEEP
ncbi:MAG: ribosome-binding factor A [Myxococcota bacterium]